MSEEINKKELGELFKDFINNSFLVSKQSGCFHGLESIDFIQMFHKDIGKTFVFHVEAKVIPDKLNLGTKNPKDW